MDHGDHMPLPGSASYYMQQRGLVGSGAQPELHVSPSFNQLSNPNLPFQSSIGGGSNIGSTLPLESLPISSQGVNVSGPTGVPSGEIVKRKRGRPRKYGSDRVVSLALSPSPAPSSNPGTMTQGGLKRGRGRPLGSGKKQQLASFGESMPGSAGVGFTPHVVHVAIGEDISAKVIALSQMRARALCVLSGFGSVSAVTLGQPSSSGGTVQYEGHFEILSLSGSLLPTENGSIRDRDGGISVMLSSPDGRIFGGKVVGQLIASAPTKVMVGTFLWGRLNAKNKKKESSEDAEGAVESVHQGAHNPGALNSISPNQNLTPTSSLSPWSAASRPMDMRNSHADIDLMRG
ncbi:AT-hook motif nuclear-localized protein [Trifolium repens]|nr:AT-hook motif nuclear-localized protein [Trifolium repens]